MTTPLHPTAHITRDADTGEYTVTTSWVGAPLDRPSTHGYRFGPRHRRLAERLAAAIDAGAVYSDPTVTRDINGATYVAATARVLGKYANADLRRLGY